MSFLDVASQATAQLMLVSPQRPRSTGAEDLLAPPILLPAGASGDVIRAESIDA
jgi:hypothetical protein